MKFITSLSKSSLIFYVMLILTFGSFFYQVYSYRFGYLKKYDPKISEERYSYSQFNRVGNQIRYILEDDEVYSWAGYSYLKSPDPTIVNFEHPPLGKILIGLSIKIFGNEKIIQILWAVLFLVVLYKLSLSVIQNKTLALVPLIIMLWDPLFRDQLRLSLLDLPQVFFMLWAIYLVIKKNINRRDLLLIGLCLGAVVSIKFFASGIIFGAFIYLVLTSIRKVKIKQLILPTLIAISIYLISYLGYFLSGHGILDFVMVHFYVLRFYKDFIPSYPPFEIWRIIMIGEWRVWFGNTEFIKAPAWWIGWPIGVIATIFVIFYKKLSFLQKIPAIWVMFYLATNSFHVVFTRYLLTVLPIAYIYFTYLISAELGKIKNRK